MAIANSRVVEDILGTLYTDFIMLKDESWTPDKHSCNASMDSVMALADALKEAGVIDKDFELEYDDE